MEIDVTRGDVRRIMETAFEPQGDGFAYYRNVWAKGVPVTAAERELFVDAWTPEKSRAFHRLIAGRAPVAPARGLKPFGRIARALPVGVVSAIAAGGLAALGLGWDGASGPARLALWSVAGFLAVVAAVLFWFRRSRP